MWRGVAVVYMLIAAVLYLLSAFGFEATSVWTEIGKMDLLCAGLLSIAAAALLGPLDRCR